MLVFPRAATAVTAVWYRNIKSVEILVAAKFWRGSTQHTLISRTFSCRFAELCVGTTAVGSQIVFKSRLGYVLA